MTNNNARIVALDIGSRRIGVATANVVARLASPLTTIVVSPSSEPFERIRQILAEQTAAAVVLGLPRGMQGQDTDQTKAIQEFGSKLQQQITIPLFWQDEALTSHVSRQDLQAKNQAYKKEDVDALAATYILEDFLASKAGARL